MNLDIEKIKVTQNSLSYQKCCVNSDLQSLFEPLVLDDDSLLQDKIFESLLFNGSMKDLLHYIGSIYTTPEDSRLFLRRSDGKYISDQYIRASIVEKNPLVLQRCSKELANFCINKFLKPDIIVGSQSGGIRVSAKVGELLRKESTYLEKSSTGLKHTQRHNVDFLGKKVLIIEDEIKSSQDLQDIVDIITSRGGEIVGIGCIFNTLRKETCLLSDNTSVPIFSNYIPDIPTRYYDENTESTIKLLCNELAPNSIVENDVKKNRSHITTYQQEFIRNTLGNISS